MTRIPAKATLCIALAFLPAIAPEASAAAEPADRVAVEEVVSAINKARTANRPAALEALLASDLNSVERTAIVKSEETVCAAARVALSEVTIPRLDVLALRLITPDVMEVDAANVEYGSLILMRRWDVLLVLKKEGSAWRITSIYNRAPLPSPPVFHFIA